MEKKTYRTPHAIVVEIEMESPLAESQFDAPVHNPSDEVDAGDALSREDNYLWGE